MIQTLNVELAERSYPIYIGSGLLSQPELLTPHLGQKQAVVVTNTTVAPLYLDTLRSTLQKGGIAALPVILPDGEKYKTWETLNLIFDALIGSGQFGLGTVGSGEAIGDFLGSFIQRLRDRRPHEFHREPHEDQEDDGLNEQGRIDTHGNTFLKWR